MTCKGTTLFCNGKRKCLISAQIGGYRVSWIVLFVSSHNLCLCAKGGHYVVNTGLC